MHEDRSDRCSITSQDFERTIVDHGTTGVSDSAHTSDDSRGTQNEHGVGTQERAFGGLAIYSYDVADTYVVVIGFHHHVCGSRICPELGGIKRIVVVKNK